MVPIVHKPLCNVFDRDSELSERPDIQNALVRHVALLTRVKNRVVGTQSLHDIICAQNGGLRGPNQTLFAHHGDVGKGDWQNGCASPWACGNQSHGTIFTGLVRCCGGQKGHQVLCDTNRSNSWATSAVRNGKGLVEIQVSHIDAKLCRSAKTDQSIQVGAIHVDLSAKGVNDL